jgi:hypothetical protein
MLTVDDDEFWEDVQPLEINGLPAMQESVMVVGFPTGWVHLSSIMLCADGADICLQHMVAP